MCRYFDLTNNSDMLYNDFPTFDIFRCVIFYLYSINMYEYISKIWFMSNFVFKNITNIRSIRIKREKMNIL